MEVQHCEKSEIVSTVNNQSIHIKNQIIDTNRSSQKLINLFKDPIKEINLKKYSSHDKINPNHPLVLWIILPVTTDRTSRKRMGNLMHVLSAFRITIPQSKFLVSLGSDHC